MSMYRFTVYRPRLNVRGSHDAYQSNPDDMPQFEGVVFTDGSVVVRWLTPSKSTSVWDNMDILLRVHGHPEYGTVLQFHDGPLPEPLRSIVDSFMMTSAPRGLTTPPK